MIEKRELEEMEIWAGKKLSRIEKYEKEGIMPEQCSKKLALELIMNFSRKILAIPEDPGREIYEAGIELAHKQL